jgi:hypothetical protein
MAKAPLCVDSPLEGGKSLYCDDVGCPDTCAVGGLTSSAGKTLPNMTAGETTTLVWAANGHTFFTSDQSALSYDTGRFAYVWHSPSASPDDTLLDTAPYSQHDWHSCDTNTVGIDVPGSAQPSVICKGNFTISPRLQAGIHNFVCEYCMACTKVVY